MYVKRVDYIMGDIMKTESIDKLRGIRDDLLKIKGIELLSSIDVKHLVFIVNFSMSKNKNNSDVN